MEASKERRDREQREQLKEQEALPTESSPYVKYEDLEDYKMKGYGTQGHRQSVELPHGGGGGTDAPTLSGSRLSEREARDADPVKAPALSSRGLPEGEAPDEDPVRRLGVP